MLYAFRDDARIIFVAASSAEEYQTFQDQVDSGVFSGWDIARPDTMAFLTDTVFDGLDTAPIIGRFADAQAEEEFATRYRVAIVERVMAEWSIGEMSKSQNRASAFGGDKRTVAEILGTNLSDPIERTPDSRARAGATMNAQAAYANARMMGTLASGSFSSNRITNSTEGKDADGNSITVFDESVIDDMIANAPQLDGFARFVIGGADRERVFHMAGIDFQRVGPDGEIDLGAEESSLLVSTARTLGLEISVKLLADQAGIRQVLIATEDATAEHIREALELPENYDMSEFSYRMSWGEFPPLISITPVRHFEKTKKISRFPLSPLIGSILGADFEETQPGDFVFHGGSSIAAHTKLLDEGFANGGTMNFTRHALVHALVDGYDHPRFVIAHASDFYAGKAGLSVDHPAISSWREISHGYYEATGLRLAEANMVLTDVSSVVQPDFTAFVAANYPAGTKVHDGTAAEMKISGADGVYHRVDITGVGLGGVRALLMAGNISVSEHVSDARDTSVGCWLAFVDETHAASVHAHLFNSGFDSRVAVVDGAGARIEDNDLLRPWTRPEQFAALPISRQKEILATIAPDEFCFYVEDSDAGAMITIVPGQYFEEKGALWETEEDFSSLLPVGAIKVSPTTYNLLRRHDIEVVHRMVERNGFIDDFNFTIYMNAR